MPGARPDPYLIPGPALISFSGGRTSGYMLHEIVRAYGGALPDNVHVAFANTGKEREETLRFVHDCETRWDVRVRWVEWRPEGFAEASFNSASRNGEPFAQVIAKKSYLPNAVTRFCTVELKITVMRNLMRSLGYESWVNAIGLRYDEGMRVMKALDRNAAGKERFTVVMPLSRAHVTRRDVMAFWAKQPFDLKLNPHEGNCDLCFLKGRAKLEAIIRDDPIRADWWIEQERAIRAVAKTPDGAMFLSKYRYSYADLVSHVAASPRLPFDDDEHDAECGLLCEP